jgi:hypothetical protein
MVEHWQQVTPAAILRVSFVGADCMLMIYLLHHAHAVVNFGIFLCEKSIVNFGLNMACIVSTSNIL